MKNRNTIFTTIVIACFGLFPTAFAVVPPPDGGYPGANTAEGQNALLNLTTGGFNTAVGYFSLSGVTTGNFNTAIGAGALFVNTADENTATGFAALLSNTQGDFNTANGAFALYSNNTGERNTAMGDSALYSNSTGSRNTAHGNAALVTNTTGHDNTAIGAFALQRNNGYSNTAIGATALRANTSGIFNNAVGDSALFRNTTGNSNVAVGNAALSSNTTGNDNTAMGHQALLSINTGSRNTAVGEAALSFNGYGSSNTAVGEFALGQAIGDNNTALGKSAGTAVSLANNVICIGTIGQDLSDSCFIGNIWNRPGGSQPVYVNSDGKLGAQVSSRRFKDDIRPINQASEAIHRLRPVSFRYKSEVEPTRPLSFGLIAEEVEKVNPDLVTRAEDGKPLSVRYDQVNVMLLNEFLKDHRTVQELKSAAAKQEKTIAQQQKQIEALTAGLQKVSAQIELRKVAPNLVRQ